MTNLNETDLLARLYITVCCIADKANKLATRIGTGSGDIECKMRELQVLEVMLEILRCYKTSDTEDYDLNCLTEEQAQAMCDYISEKCEVCFQRPGFNYQ